MGLLYRGSAARFLPGQAQHVKGVAVGTLDVPTPSLIGDSELPVVRVVVESRRGGCRPVVKLVGVEIRISVDFRGLVL